MEFTQDIAQNIKLARKAAGLTQQDLADKSGVAAISIRQYETGKRTPRLEQLRALAAALDVSAIALLEGDAQTYRALQDFARQDASREGSTQAAAETEIAREILDQASARRILAALDASETALTDAFRSISEQDILSHLFAIAQDELTREGRILLLKYAHALAQQHGYNRLRAGGPVDK